MVPTFPLAYLLTHLLLPGHSILRSTQLVASDLLRLVLYILAYPY